jgi:hemoglobin-like flavoprotein
MTERQILLVKNSWSFVIVKSEEAGLLFYDRLFEIAPELQPVFKTHPKEQALRLTNMVTNMVSRIQHLDEIIDDIRALASRHSVYGVQTVYYRVFGAALIWTIQQMMDTRWNDELEEAWIDVYSLISNAMIQTQEAIAV